MEEKRLFFAYEVEAPWPEKYPKGRLIHQGARHCTLAFLGNVLEASLKKILVEFPVPPFKVGPVGFFDDLLMLPARHPRVIAWHVEWLEEIGLETFQQMLVDWLTAHRYTLDRRRPLPHVTMARRPFNLNEWREDFKPLPLFVRGLHLYESSENLIYRPIWSYPLPAPIEKCEGKILVRAESLQQLCLHAQMAVVCEIPSLLKGLKKNVEIDSFKDILMILNQLVGDEDCVVSCVEKMEESYCCELVVEKT